jgi:hypothetical protein
LAANTKVIHNDTYKNSSLLRNIKPDNIVQVETIPVSAAEMKTIIMSLKPKHSTGYDGIPNKTLKYCVHSINKPLSYMHNLSMTTGIFSESCKFAILRPIYKKGHKRKISNYRAIFLLTDTSGWFSANGIALNMEEKKYSGI